MDKQIFVLLGLVISLILVYLYLEKFNPKNLNNYYMNSSPNHQTVNSYKSIESFTAGQDFSIDKYGIPFDEIKDIAYMSFFVPMNTVLVILKYDKGVAINDILKNGELVGIVDAGGKITRFETPLDLASEKISVYQNTKIGESYWAGHIYINGKAYTTGGRDYICEGIEDSGNKRDDESIVNSIKSKLPRTVSDTLATNLIEPGGERIGCYYDKGGCECNGASPPAFEKEYRRVLDENNEEIESQYKRLEECREKATLEGHKYFALGNHGICYTHPESSNQMVGGQSTQIDGRVTVTQYGKTNPSKCNISSYHKQPRNFSGLTYGGGHNILDIHTLQDQPGIRTYGGESNTGTWIADDYIDLANAQPGLASPEQGGGLSGILHPETRVIQVDFGAEPVDNVKKGYHVIQRWILFTLDPEGDDKLEYCPDRKFAEFNGGACFDGSDTEACSNSPKKGYIPNKRKCLTNLKKVYIGEEDYKFKNRYFFGTVLDLFTSIQSLYHSKRLGFFRDLVIIDKTVAEQKIGFENQGTISDLTQFREKLSSVLLGNVTTTNIGNASVNSYPRGLFHLIHNTLNGSSSGLYQILVRCCTLISSLYNNKSDISSICLGDDSKGIRAFPPGTIRTLIGYATDNSGLPVKLDPYQTGLKYGGENGYIQEIIKTFSGRFLEYDASGNGMVENGTSMIGADLNPQVLANKIYDIIVAACSTKYATDSLEDSKREVISKVANFAENANEIIHKINFLFSSCKCMPGTNSVYCTPC